MANYTFKDVLSVFKQTGSEFMDNNSLRLAGALAYNTIFALPPLMIIVITAAGLIWKDHDFSTQLTSQMQGMVGKDGAEQIDTMIKNVNRNDSKGIMGAVGIATLIFAATTFFVTLQESLNTIWNVKAKPQNNIKKLLKDRLLSFGLIISISFLMLISFVVSAILTILMDYLQRILPGIAVIFMQLTDIIISAGVITCLFALVFKYLPDAIIRWKDVWVGAFITAALFVLGKYLIGFYLGNSDVASAYGAAGSIIIILVWIYYSSLIVFFGAEFTQEYAAQFGEKIRPKPHAVQIEIREVPFEDTHDSQAGRPPAQGRFRKE